MSIVKDFGFALAAIVAAIYINRLLANSIPQYASLISSTPAAPAA